MNQLDPTVQSSLDTVYIETAAYLEHLGNAHDDAMAIMDAHDAFCRKVLQNAEIRRLFGSFGRLAALNQEEAPELTQNYDQLVRSRLSLISIADPHRRKIEVSLLVGLVRTSVEVLRESQLAQIDRMALA